MQKFRNWTAKRAGGKITINAIAVKTDDPIKVVGVDEIYCTKKGTVIASRQVPGASADGKMVVEKFELMTAVEIPG